MGYQSGMYKGSRSMVRQVKVTGAQGLDQENSTVSMDPPPPPSPVPDWIHTAFGLLGIGTLPALAWTLWGSYSVAANLTDRLTVDFPRLI